LSDLIGDALTEGVEVFYRGASPSDFSESRWPRSIGIRWKPVRS